MLLIKLQQHKKNEKNQFTKLLRDVACRIIQAQTHIPELLVSFYSVLGTDYIDLAYMAAEIARLRNITVRC